MIFKENFIEYSSNQKIESKHSIKKKGKNSIWKFLFIVAGTITAIVSVRVEKRLIWEKKWQKVLEIFGKVWDNKRKLLKGPKNLTQAKIRDVEIQDTESFCFDKVLDDLGTR